ncbi:hypothetical protein GCM10010334_80260 [Streptomyces finlayi]|uniref:DUF4389 domain-containing protein n=1 Tax=Streptomyces finlayi TaxID=67296 RepID=A0A918X882_9ACTN|nr:hypothetical protein GCM10010334_80260 [Streptomyces finlayi]
MRWLLLIPQFIVVWALGIAAFFVTIVGWFAALFTGRLPEGIFQFLSSVLAYTTRVHASAALLVDSYPPFSLAAPRYPVQIEVRPTALNRLAVLFRLFLLIPAAIIAGLLQSGWAAVSWMFWLVTLVLGRQPAPLYGATAAVARYNLRLNAYAYLLTPAYPKRLFGEAALPVSASAPSSHPAEGTTPSGTRPLILDTGAKVLLVLILLLGLAGQIVSATTTYGHDHRDGYSVTR